MVRLLLITLLALVACSNKDRDDAKVRSKPADPALDDFLVARGQKDLRILMEKIAAESVTLYDCAVITYLDDLDRVDASLALKLRRLCTRDVQVSLLERGLAKAEPARATNPDAISLPECSDPTVGLAIEDLEKYKTLDDQSRKLVARFDVICPVMAKARADRAKRAASKPI